MITLLTVHCSLCDYSSPNWSDFEFIPSPLGYYPICFNCLNSKTPIEPDSKDILNIEYEE